MTKICHITSVHTWNDVRIFEKECTSLASAGFDVILIAVNAVEHIQNGVNIISVNETPRSRRDRMMRIGNMIYNKAVETNADIYHIHDPELLRIGIKLLKKNEKKVIYDAHEDLPRQIMDKPYIHALFRRIISLTIEFYENRIASGLSGIVAATSHIQKRFLKLNPNTVNINNYPVLKNLKIETNYSERKNEVCYIGGIFETRGIKELIDAMEMTDVRLNLAGNYSPESLKSDLEKKRGWKKVNEYGFVNRDGIREILTRSKIGIVTLYPTLAYLESLPVKMFEYMAAGIPVISSDFPIWRSIIDKHQCGICVNPKNPKEIADAINYLLSNEKLADEMGQRGKKAADEIYNWGVEEKKLIAFYSSIVKMTR